MRSAARRAARTALSAQRRAEHSSARPPGASSVQKYDEERFGGWKSAEMLFVEEPARKSLVGRWDWHVVQFLLALVPPGAALLLVHWARHDMSKLEARKQAENLARESSKLEA
ncbi:Whirly transcription factor [Micractinium conductrix]|uniref:Whirly transcription factor n=1 Tax=Micractinium conductrix TaxID=554055 RepID=A0A2P6VDL7_9CHLO|nr:Whirly transcription factor [Micractinium conductrix]|eukprot:PSC72185.1 Whirly transcription factor [Micractinium conductrix]